MFAVYIKCYRRINHAKYELSRTNETKPHNELTSIYEYANNIQTLFLTINKMFSVQILQQQHYGQ